MSEEKSHGIKFLSLLSDSKTEEELIMVDKIVHIRKTQSKSGDCWYIHITTIDKVEPYTIGPLDYDKYKDMTAKDFLSSCIQTI